MTTASSAKSPDIVPVQPRETATQLLAQILDVLQADRGLDMPADETDYRDYPIGTAASTIYADNDRQYQYVYIPNAPRDLTLWTGTRSQYLGSWAEGAQINFRMPRQTGLTIEYGAGSADETLSVYFSARPIEINSVGSSSSAIISATHAEDSPAASGDLGVMMLGVRNDNLSTIPASANGDYSAFSVNSRGAQYVVAGGSAVSDGSSALAIGAVAVNGGSEGHLLAAMPMLSNGVSKDLARNNVEGTALASAARTASTQSADIVNYNGDGVIIFIDVTAIAATPSIVVTIQEKDPVSGAYFDVLSSAAIVATGRTKLTVHPGETVVANVSASHVLSRTFRVSVVNADADSITYSVGYCIASN